MTRKRVGGTLSSAALQALQALRRNETGEAGEPRHFDRPTDHVDYLREARHLLAEGATVSDVGYALGLTTVVIRRLLGPARRRDSGTGMAPKRPKAPRKRVELKATTAVAAETVDDQTQQDHVGAQNE